VLAAAKQLRRQAEFRLVGPIRVSGDAQKELANYTDLAGPVPRSETAEHFRWADVFLLPSLCEGSATATYEALAYGLPVICTPNTGSVVRNGIEGFIVPPAEVSPIVERLEELSADADLLVRMSHAALERAREFTLESYAQRLLAAIK